MELSRKKNLIVFTVLFLVLGLIGYLWINKSVSNTESDIASVPLSSVNSEDGAAVDSQAAEAGGVTVTTDKTRYIQGEDIKFVITNHSDKTMWYITSAGEYDKNLYVRLSRQDEDNSWSDGAMIWLDCGGQDVKGVDSLKVSKVEPGKSLEQKWSQRVIFDGAESTPMIIGTFRFAFPYSENEIALKDIPALDSVEVGSFFSKWPLSNDIEIEDDSETDLVVKKTHDALRKSNLNYIYGRLVSYFDDHNSTYPISGDKMDKLNDKNATVYKELVPKYVDANTMKDPEDPDSYFGYRSLDGKGFELTAVLENTEDKDCVKKNNLCIYELSLNGEYIVPKQ